MSNIAVVQSSTGPTQLEDVGKLYYGGVTFSALFKSKLSGEERQDNAKRAIMGVNYTLSIEGVVTLPDGQASLDPTFSALRQQLSVPGQNLIFGGKGFGELSVNGVGGVLDMAFGPIPKVISWESYGNGGACKLTMQFTFFISELQTIPPFAGAGSSANPILQFSYDTSISYDEDDYTTISLSGLIEIPMTYSQGGSPQIPIDSVDLYRQRYLDIQFDLTKFRVTKRQFNVSSDRRKIDWTYQVEELPPMGLPPGCPRGRGTMSVRMLKAGRTGSRFMPMLGFSWVVTLRATYTIRADYPRRAALLAFYALAWFRFQSYVNGVNPQGNPNGQGQQALPNVSGGVAFTGNPTTGGQALLTWYSQFFNQTVAGVNNAPSATRPAMITDFSFDEGVYLDSKTITFEMSWFLLTTFATLLQATGVWRWQRNAIGGQTWAQSMQDIQGWRSWKRNLLDRNVDVIVNMGQQPPTTNNPFA